MWRRSILREICDALTSSLNTNVGTYQPRPLPYMPDHDTGTVPFERGRIAWWRARRLAKPTRIRLFLIRSLSVSGKFKSFKTIKGAKVFMERKSRTESSL